MVNHKNMILDDGKIKICPEVIEMNKPEHVYAFEKIMFDMNLKFMERELFWENHRGAHEKWDSTYGALCRECEDLSQDKYLMKYRFENQVPKCFWNTKEMCSYMKVIPFIPSVMINI